MEPLGYNPISPMDKSPAQKADNPWHHGKTYQEIHKVLAEMGRSPTKETRRLSAQMGMSQSGVMRNMRANKWHPNKLQVLQQLQRTILSQIQSSESGQ
ncbi:hypothetical protein AVEN_207596-1 [Araneus ventricosus]|uniref:Uncharacterized protein n=1 Tax=Araneus ventricosus TaxID=182803 RepID=A0A4Y2RLN8_ARAVE|nr:hypothetical protein AVEN_207596-1 [Araneus ventricosus]